MTGFEQKISNEMDMIWTESFATRIAVQKMWFDHITAVRQVLSLAAVLASAWN